MAERICDVDGCDRPHRARGLCATHYAKATYDPARAKAKHERLKDDPRYQARRKSAYDRWRAANPEKAAAATSAWRERNRDAVSLSTRATGQRRRAAIAGAEGDPLTVADYRAILASHGMTCHICGGSIASFDDLHFDHVIPLSRGGAHTVDNVRPAHGICNMRKHNRID